MKFTNEYNGAVFTITKHSMPNKETKELHLSVDIEYTQELLDDPQQNTDNSAEEWVLYPDLHTAPLVVKIYNDIVAEHYN